MEPAAKPAAAPNIPRINSSPATAGRLEKKESLTKILPSFFLGKTNSADAHKLKRNSNLSTTQLSPSGNIPILARFNHLPIYDTELFLNQTMNASWKREIEVAYKQKSLYLDQIQNALKARVFSVIDDFVKQSDNKRALPEAHDFVKQQNASIFHDALELIDVDSTFLDVLKKELRSIREKYLDIAFRDKCRTTEGIIFFKTLNSLIRTQEFPQFIDELIRIKKDKFHGEIYYLILLCFGVDRENYIKKSLVLWHERFKIDFYNVIDEVAKLHAKAPSIKTRIWQGVFTQEELNKLDSLENCEVIRGFFTNDGKINIPVKINRKDPKPSNGSYLQGMIYLINEAYFQNVDLIEKRTSEETARFLVNKAIPSSRALKVCTNNSWIKADLLIRNLLNEFFQMPFITKARGMACRISVLDVDRYHVVVSRYYKIYKRRIEDDPSCLVKEGKHIGRIGFIYRVHCNPDNVKAGLHIHNWEPNRKVKVTWMDQILFCKIITKMVLAIIAANQKALTEEINIDL